MQLKKYGSRSSNNLFTMLCQSLRVIFSRRVLASPTSGAGRFGFSRSGTEMGLTGMGGNGL